MNEEIMRAPQGVANGQARSAQFQAAAAAARV
jgi:hypothetical protein